QIDHFSIKSFHARFIQANLFDEVSQSAGVYRIAPRFGSPGNQGFVAHGVAVHDVDQDGFLDVFVTGATENFLYINQGDGTFKNRSESAGVQTTPTVSAPLFLDYDNDGDSDLFMAAPGDQMLYENRMIPDGTLEFLNVSYEAGVGHLAQGFSAISADVNNDGLPDIYVASYNKYGLVMPNSWFQATNGTPNLLFINQGDGRFAEKAAAWGVADNRWSYAAQFGDLNGDGRADLYVANDFGQNAFYLNRGTHFSDAAAELGLLDPGNGMGVSFGDYDNDGLLDIHVTNMSSTAGNRILKRLFPDAMTQLDDTRVLNKLAAGNTVFKNLDNGQFKDVSATLGPFSAGWAFGGGFVDFDND
ncbi:MAG: VCBS repeat-containing protein, partial [Candidatus Latescibacteria bacterium]|nr:VCBS repeat-containing protein [Candidatus Latescibacterota bacterium]